ncbi:ribonuclease III [Myxococcota bacterium]|nr:ribonuclease III [Myxococcota bacterium]
MSEPESREAVRFRLEAVLHHRFARPELLETALRHASYAHETGEGGSNERLEFLGDAVLGLVVAHALFAAHPDWREGDLTRAQAALVEARSLARHARDLELGSALVLGRTEQSSGGHEKASILADAFEAVVGALFVDGGLAAVERFVHARFAAAFAAGSAPVARDPKTELQERTMAAVGVFPTYQLVADSGIEGDEQRFTIEVALCGEALARASDRTKRAAEREAARIALSTAAVAKLADTDAATSPGASPPAEG